MASKKKSAKKSVKSKPSSAKTKPAKKHTPKKKTTQKRKASTKSASATAPRKNPAKAKPPAKKAAARSTAERSTAVGRTAGTTQTSRKSPRRAESPFSGSARDTESAGQSGDLQGLSNVRGADSESVDELLEEGNSFEAEVVSGVEDADEHEGQEVHTHEVPEDDVPGEYLDEE